MDDFLFLFQLLIFLHIFLGLHFLNHSRQMIQIIFEKRLYKATFPVFYWYSALYFNYLTLRITFLYDFTKF